MSDEAKAFMAIGEGFTRPALLERDMQRCVHLTELAVHLLPLQDRGRTTLGSCLATSFRDNDRHGHIRRAIDPAGLSGGAVDTSRRTASTEPGREQFAHLTILARSPRRLKISMRWP